jgi:hypothetical protein
MANRDFCFALVSYALRFQTQPGIGRLLPKAATAGGWIALAATRQHPEFTRIAKTRLKKGKEKKHETESE